uniref:DUF2345 domain-containing protein n=1 Tax=Acinetobacter pittii TaxID=48296 RepID=UPI001CD3B85E
KQDQAQGVHLEAAEAKQQIEGGLSNAKALSEVAKNQQTDPLENLENLKSFIEKLEQQDNAKAKTFKEAIMLLASPNSVALSSNEDIHLSADGQLNQTAGDSINLSTQKNLIAHAQNKISLFAAQEGARLYAGKGKVEIQAQGDGADLIARKAVQVISTEDKIEATAAKEIVLTAGGSQVKITGSGIFMTTSGKFEVKAGQHLFMGGQTVTADLPNLPSSPNGKYILEFDVRHKLDNLALESLPTYSLIDSKGNIRTGSVPKDGIVRVASSDKEEKFTLMVHKYDVEAREEKE